MGRQAGTGHNKIALHGKETDRNATDASWRWRYASDMRCVTLIWRATKCNYSRELSEQPGRVAEPDGAELAIVQPGRAAEPELVNAIGEWRSLIGQGG